MWRETHLLQQLCLLVLLSFTSGLEVGDLNDAVKLRQVDIVSTLLRAGADINIRDSLGWLPLHNAANTGQCELVQLLLNHQADPDTPEPIHGRSSVHLAAYNGHQAVLQLLLDAGANVDLRDAYGQTPLHLAVWRGQVGVVVALLQQGAEVDVQDARGSTPLMLAAIQDSVEVTKELLPFCPDHRIPDKQGKNVMQYIKEINLTRIHDVVFEHLQRPCRSSVIQQLAAVRNNTIVEGESCPPEEKRHPDQHSPFRWWLPTTVLGMSVDLPCPPGTNGSATWTCGYDGTWHRMADLSQCRAVLFSGWQKVIKTKNVSAAEAMKDMANSLQSVVLAPGDLITLSLILKMLSEKHAKDAQHSHTPLDTLRETQDFLQGLMDVADKMLLRPVAWWGLPPCHMVTTTSHIQTSLAAGALTLATYQKSPSQEISRDRLYVKAVQQPSAFFNPLVRRTFSHPKYNQTSITLPPQFYRDYVKHLSTIKVAFVSYSNLHCIFNSLPWVRRPVGASLHNSKFTAKTVRDSASSMAWDCLSGEVGFFPENTTINEESDPERMQLMTDLPALKQINSAILGVTVGGTIIWHAPLGEVVEVELQHLYSGHSFRLGRASCVWWDEHTSSWATDGCHLALTSPTHTLCHCNHLANMAVMMDIEGPQEISGVMFSVMKCVTVISCVVSVAILALCVFCLLSLKDMRGKTCKIIQGNLCLCLLAMELVVLGSLRVSGKPGPCAAVVTVFHYVTLTTFIWSAIEALHTYISTIQGVKVGPWVVWCCLCVGYLVPLVYVATIQALSLSLAHHTNPVCQLAPRSLGWTIASPLAAIVLVNVAALMMGARASWCEDSSKTAKSPGQSFCSSFSVFVLLCLTWIAGLLYFIEGSHETALVFTILNFFLGVSILFLQVIMEHHGIKQ